MRVIHVIPSKIPPSQKNIFLHLNHRYVEDRRHPLHIEYKNQTPSMSSLKSSCHDPDEMIILCHFPSVLYIQHLSIPPTLDKTKMYIPLPASSFCQRKKSRTLPSVYAFFPYHYHTSSSLSLWKDRHDVIMSPSLFVSSIWTAQGSFTSLLRLDADGTYHYANESPCFLVTDTRTWYPDIHRDLFRHLSSIDLHRLRTYLPRIDVIVSQSRRPYIERELSTHYLMGIATMIPAILPKESSKYLSRGQLGCFQSHQKILQQCCHETTPTLILEDDIMVNPSLLYQWIGDFIVHIMENVPDNWDMIYLGGCWDHCRYHKQSGSKLYRQIYSPLCSHAYIVHGRTASLLLEDMNVDIRQEQHPYDHFLKHAIKKHKWKVYSPTLLEPFLQNPHLQSTIQDPLDTFFRQHVTALPSCVEEVYSFSSVFLLLWCLLCGIFLVLVIIYMIQYFKR